MARRMTIPGGQIEPQTGEAYGTIGTSLNPKYTGLANNMKPKVKHIQPSVYKLQKFLALPIKGAGPGHRAGDNFKTREIRLTAYTH